MIDSSKYFIFQVHGGNAEGKKSWKKEKNLMCTSFQTSFPNTF